MPDIRDVWRKPEVDKDVNIIAAMQEAGSSLLRSNACNAARLPREEKSYAHSGGSVEGGSFRMQRCCRYTRFLLGDVGSQQQDSKSRNGEGDDSSQARGSLG